MSCQVELQEQTTQPPPSSLKPTTDIEEESGEIESENENEKVTIDEMLEKYCGEFGRWQWKNFMLANLSWCLEALHTMVLIFADHEPRWRCVVDDGIMGCDQKMVKSICEMKTGMWEWVDEDRGSSTVAQWDLICDHRYKVGLAQALFFLGCMIGSGLFGHLSDSALGRKRSLAIICIFNTIFGILTALSPNYWIYALLRALTGIATGGIVVCSFVLATEPIGPNKRGVAGLSTFYFFVTGTAVLSGMAYAIPSWRKLYIASSIPSFLYLIAALPFISESPRWYLARGNLVEAMKLMNAIAKSNGKQLPKGVILVLDKETENSDTKHNNHVSVGSSFIVLISSSVIRTRLVISMATSFIGAIIYYGLSFNVVNLKTNLYLTVFLNAVAETPAFVITAALSSKIGRKQMGTGTFWFSGVFCLMGGLVKSNGKWKLVRMACGVLGILGMAGNFNMLFLYLEELFPTVVRNAGIGSAALAAQLGAILAPFVVVMGGGLPFLVFGICGLVGGILIFFLPETLNKPLYDTMAGLEYGEKASQTT